MAQSRTPPSAKGGKKGFVLEGGDQRGTTRNLRQFVDLCYSGVWIAWSDAAAGLDVDLCKLPANAKVGKVRDVWVV